MSLKVLVGCVVSFLHFVQQVAHADAREEAHVHYQAGVIAFESLRYAEAAVEFERAYAQAPAWQVLYNLGTVYAALDRPIQAITTLSRYLEQADDSVGSVRRDQVQAEIEAQRAKTGLLELRIDSDRAEVRVDGRTIGHSPLSEPIRLTAGSHMIEVRREGRRSESHRAQVEAGEHSVLTLKLTASMRSDVTAVREAPPTAADRPDPNPGRLQRVLGYSLGAAGLIGVTVGALVAGIGQRDHNDAVELVLRGQRPEAEALEADANTQKVIGFTSIGVGAAFVTAGAVLVLIAPDASPSVTNAAWRVSGWAKAASAGVSLQGSW